MNRFEDIRQWAADRNIIAGTNSRAQFVKLMEEIGELASGIAKNRLPEILDGIGDAVVVLTVLAKQNGLNIEDCIETAWYEIKDRKGKMVDGIFVKEADLKPCRNRHCECAVGSCSHPGYRDARGESE